MELNPLAVVCSGLSPPFRRLSKLQTALQIKGLVLLTPRRTALESPRSFSGLITWLC